MCIEYANNQKEKKNENCFKDKTNLKKFAYNIQPINQKREICIENEALKERRLPPKLTSHFHESGKVSLAAAQ